MATQSTFSRFPKKQLVFISNKLIEDGFEWENITYDYDSVIDLNESILESVAKYFNESVVEEDIQFFIKFIEVNQALLTKINETNDSSLIEQLIIPQPNDYIVEYTVDGRCSYIEYYEDTFTSYDRKWVMDSLYRQKYSGDFDIYSGHLKNTEYDNWEPNDFEVNEVKEYSNTQESRNPRKLLENTEKLIPKLDKDTLITLKFLIDKQLRSL